MRSFVREHWRFFLISPLAGLALRGLFALWFARVVDDSLLYGDIAKNWLHYGIYGITDSGVVHPTYIRLPGYPALLAFVFALFGDDHYRPVLILQVLADLGTCFAIADMARRTLKSVRAVKTAFLMAALCPFLANYSVIALTETLEIFFTALALDFAIAAFEDDTGRFRFWIATGLASGGAILLRPDGGIVPAAIGIYALARWLPRRDRRTLAAMGIFAVVTLACLLPWTVRNWRTFHHFQPLAPRYTNMPSDFVPYGFQRWAKTWIADYVSVEEIYWSEPGNKMNADLLPERASDSAEQREKTEELLDDYNTELALNPDMDARFGALAEERIRSHPCRYYLRLPLLRMADMWLRPRTEMLPVDTRWWEFNDDWLPMAAAVAFGLLNLGYVAAGICGFAGRRLRFAGVLLAFLLLRTVFLGTLENPEPRYTLEGYPAVIVAAAAALL